MFQLGIFTTHLPYILLVFFYLLSFVIQHSDEKETTPNDVSVCCDRNYPITPDGNASSFSRNNPYAYQKTARKAFDDFLTDAKHLLQTPLLRGAPKILLLRDNYLFSSSLSNRPPPSA